jgi:hypothetical protein
MLYFNRGYESGATPGCNGLLCWRTQGSRDRKVSCQSWEFIFYDMFIFYMLIWEFHWALNKEYDMTFNIRWSKELLGTSKRTTAVSYFLGLVGSQRWRKRGNASGPSRTFSLWQTPSLTFYFDKPPPKL